MTSELKACPFCFHKKPVKKRVCRGGALFVRCYTHDCPASFAFVLDEIWNRRAHSPAVARLVEACRDLAGQAKCFDIDMCYFREIDDALAAVEKEIQ